MKTARKSFGAPYECKQAWNEDCFVQCGDIGIVLSGDMQNCFESKNPLKHISEHTSYTTAFFEAFPNNPKTFIRGEGKTIVEAEMVAWNKLQKYLACENHEFERRNYTNGAGFCKHCGLFKSKAFEPSTKCCICGVPTYYTIDKKDNWYCKDHKKSIPEENKTEHIRFVERMKKASDESDYNKRF